MKIDYDMVKNKFPARKSDANKGDFGRVFIIGSSRGMTGAAVMAAHSALRCGCGLVTVGVPESLNCIIEMKTLEVMSFPLKDDDCGGFSALCASDMLKKALESDVVVFGPGIGKGENVRFMLEKLIIHYTGKLLIDADGLNALSLDLSILKKASGSIVLTPHPGEMSRLSGLSISKIQADRTKIAKAFTADNKITLVLKGENTVVTNGEQIYINTTGNSGLATAGTGDVLSGMIASFAGQGLNLLDASIVGVYLHGAAGDIACKKRNPYSLIAGDVIDHIYCAINTILQTGWVDYE